MLGTKRPIISPSKGTSDAMGHDFPGRRSSSPKAASTTLQATGGKNRASMIASLGNRGRSYSANSFDSANADTPDSYQAGRDGVTPLMPIAIGSADADADGGAGGAGEAGGAGQVGDGSKYDPARAAAAMAAAEVTMRDHMLSTILDASLVSSTTLPIPSEVSEGLILGGTAGLIDVMAFGSGLSDAGHGMGNGIIESNSLTSHRRMRAEEDDDDDISVDNYYSLHCEDSGGHGGKNVIPVTESPLEADSGFEYVDDETMGKLQQTVQLAIHDRKVGSVAPIRTSCMSRY